MIQLNATECRILGVLVEKAHTSSGYPMSLNALTDGCNQKSNRHPVVNFDEDRVMQALDTLRGKGLVIFADSLGSRVTKFRHNTREVLGVDDHELVVLVELLLRGPQTAGELRARASRMKPLESIEYVREVLERLITRPEPMVQRLPGGRAERFAQLLCPHLHPLDEPVYAGEEEGAAPRSSGASAPSAGGAGAAGGQADRIAALETQVADLRRIIERLADSLGAKDLLNQ